MGCSVCGKDKKLHARGMCVVCYRRQERAKASTKSKQAKLLMDQTRILDALEMSDVDRTAVLTIISRTMGLSEAQKSGALLFFGTESSTEHNSVPSVPCVPSVPSVPSVPCVPSVPSVPCVPSESDLKATSKKTPLERGLEAEYQKLKAVKSDYTREAFRRLWKACCGDFNELRRMVAGYEEKAFGCVGSDS